MNQILSTEMNKNKKKTSNTVDIKKVIIFFAIAIILLGLVFLVKGVITYHNNVQEISKIEQTEPEVEFQTGEEEIKLIVNHDKPIVKVTYNWNNGQEITINGNNRTSITQTITLPEGNNILTVKATDEIQSVATITKEFTKVESKLTLSFAKVENKIKITAQDTQELAYLTYKWNSGEEITVDVPEDAEDKKILEEEVEILEGLNTLTVKAVNKSGQSKEKKQDIEGIAGPKVSVQREGEYLIINAKDDNVLTLINYTLNNQPYRINLTSHDAVYYNAIEGLTVKTNENDQIVEMEYRQLMTEKGANVITITVENKRGAVSSYSGQCVNI